MSAKEPNPLPPLGSRPIGMPPAPPSRDRDELIATLRTVERDILALAEQIATSETSEQMRNQARAIATKCAAALAGSKA